MNCETGKKQFGSRKAARKNMVGGKHSRAYFCNHCHYWHITISRAYGEWNKMVAPDNKGR